MATKSKKKKEKDPRVEKAVEKAKARKQAGILAKEAGDKRAEATHHEKLEKARGKRKRVGLQSKSERLHKQADELERQLRKLKRSY